MDSSILRSFRRVTTCAAFLVAAVAAISITIPATAQADEDDIHEYCGTNIPPDEAIGFVPLPEGDVFCPLIADPKAGTSYVSYLRGTSLSPLGTDLASVGVADRFGLVRWGGPSPGEGFQLGVDGGVFAQFDLNQESYDLINADYTVAARATFRRGGSSGRLRLYHQSSHLGDEFLLRSRIPRENFSFQSAEALFSADSGPLRFYLGGEIVFRGIPNAIETQIAHGGLELRQRTSALRLGSVAGVRMIAAIDAKSIEDLSWKVAWSARAGFEVNRAKESAHAVRSWSVLAHYYDGPSPYGQFFREQVTYYGVGLHFSM
jgi:hypothetical protein